MKDECFGKELAEYKLNRAREELDTANLLFDNEKLKAANNRAYYSIYYAITAVLCLEPVAFKRHAFSSELFSDRHSARGPGCVCRIQWLLLGSGRYRPYSVCSFCPTQVFGHQDECCLAGRR